MEWLSIGTMGSLPWGPVVRMWILGAVVSWPGWRRTSAFVTVARARPVPCASSRGRAEMHQPSWPDRPHHRQWLSESRPTHETSGAAHDVRDVSSATRRLILDPLVVCGPSGVGKGTIIGRYMEQQQQQLAQSSSHDNSHNRPRRFAFAVSHTTRAPRPGEIQGVHYHFVSPAEMQALLCTDNNDSGSPFFLEHATVHGHTYGTSWDALWSIAQTNQTTALLDIDVQGVQRLRAALFSDNTGVHIQPKYMFIAPPSLDVLRQRLGARGTETEASLARRTRAAPSELDYGFSHCSQTGRPIFDAIVTNDTVEQAVYDFSRAIQRLYGGVPPVDHRPTDPADFNANQDWTAVDADNA